MTNPLNPSSFLFGESRSKVDMLAESNQENFRDMVDNYEDELNIRLMLTEMSTKKYSDDDSHEIL